MNKEKYLNLKKQIIERGYEKDIIWSQSIQPCKNGFDFFMEFGWVVVNSGMKSQIAHMIWGKLCGAMAIHKHPSTVFNHKGKTDAIHKVYTLQDFYFKKYQEAKDKKAFLLTLPYIGKITVYHLLKNLGFDCCKPDRHLVRIANFTDTTPEEMCKKLSEETGDSIATVDTVIWRAANLKLI